jgi:hypothetical protein
LIDSNTGPTRLGPLPLLRAAGVHLDPTPPHPLVWFPLDLDAAEPTATAGA